MKKRVFSALLALCMACTLAGTVWAEGTNAASGAPEPASQTLNLDNEQSGDESGADSTGAPSDSTDSSTSASSDSTSSGSSSAASDAASDVISGEGDESAASSDSTAASDSTSSSSSASSDSSDSDADDPDAAGSDVTGDESGTGAGEESGPVDEQPGASSEPVPSQPNRAPAAAAPALPAETRATANTFHITWGDYFDVTVHYVDQNGSPIDYDFGCTNQFLTSGNTLNFTEFGESVFTFEANNRTYQYSDTHYGNYSGDPITTLAASNSDNWIGMNVNYYTFSNGEQLSYQTEGIFPDKTTKTANVYLVYTYTEKPSLPEGDLYISDSVSSDGLFTATFKDNVTIPKDATVVYQWERSLDKSIWTDVDRIAVSGSEGNYIYNMTEDGVSVNVVQDASPIAANVQDDQRYWYRVTATVTANDGTKTTYSAEPVQVPYYIELQNGSFEQPVGHKQYEMGKEGLIWKTTGPGTGEHKNADIEIARPTGEGSNNQQVVENYGIPKASHGDQFAELNCEAVGTLYQDVMTIPGTTLNWQFDHVARQRRGQGGAWDDENLWDEMAMVIMPAENADYWAYQLKQAGSDAAAIRGVLARIETEVAGAYVLDNVRDQPYYRTRNDSSASWNVRGWGHYDSEDNGEPYKVPEDQYLTRFFFVSVSSGMGEISLGNCLDNVYFSKDPLPLENTKSRVIVTKNVTGVDAIPQDYSVTFHIGSQEQTLVANDFTQQGQTFTATATFTYTELSPNSSQTLTVVETGGTIGNYERKISYRVTGGETTLTGTTAETKSFDLPAGESRSVTFTNTYTPTTTDLTITKTFVGLDEEKANQVWDALGFTVASNGSTLTPAINKANDVTASANTFTATATIEGLTIGETYTVTETNADLTGYTRTTTVSGSTGVTNNEDGSADVKIDSDSNVTFTNTYTRDKGILTIQKRVEGLLSGDSASDVTFMVTITGPADAAGVTFKDANGDDRTFVASGNGASVDNVAVKPGTNVTIAELPTDHYTITEVQPSAATPNSNYEILNGKYYFVEAVNDGKDEVDLGKVGETATITNNYAPYYSVTVEKQVGGEMGSGEDWFDFTVSPKENGSLPEGMTITSTDAEVNERIDMDDHTFQLKAGATVTIGHIKANDAIVVTEAASQSGYKTTINTNNCVGATITNSGTNGVTTITVPQSGAENANLGTVTYINTRTSVAPTGLESNHTTPYVLMITAAGITGLALIGGIVARRRRRRME